MLGFGLGLWNLLVLYNNIAAVNLITEAGDNLVQEDGGLILLE